MMTNRRRAYRRTLQAHLALGVTREQCAEAIRALSADTDPWDLAVALAQYVPDHDSWAASEVPVRALIAESLPPSIAASLPSQAPAERQSAAGAFRAGAARGVEHHHPPQAGPCWEGDGGDAGSTPAARSAPTGSGSPVGAAGLDAPCPPSEGAVEARTQPARSCGYRGIDIDDVRAGRVA